MPTINFSGIISDIANLIVGRESILNNVGALFSFVVNFILVIVNLVLFFFTHLTFFFMLFEMIILVKAIRTEQLDNKLVVLIDSHAKLIGAIIFGFSWMISVLEKIWNMTIGLATKFLGLLPIIGI